MGISPFGSEKRCGIYDFATIKGEINMSEQGGGIIGTVLYFAVIIAVFYFILIRPQKKQQKQLSKMIDSMRVGDDVVTISGVLGKIVTIKEDEVTIETSADRTKLRLQKTAIKSVLTVHDEEDDEEYEYVYETVEPEKKDKKKDKKNKEF